MYDAMDLAAYVINYAISINKPVSNLSLQKILYYIQAAFLVTRGEPAFGQPISAWKYGPVVEEVYHEYKRYSSSEITVPIENKLELKFIDGKLVLKHVIIDELKFANDTDKGLIDSVVNVKTEYSALKLVRDTHKEDPWKNAIEQNLPFIDNESIRNYFDSNRECLWN